MAKNPLDIDLSDLGFGSKKTKRDSRRTFTITQKKEILYQQNNKCAICHKKLDPRAIEFDHGKPWADGGRTITQNGRALCPTCHRIKHHKERLKKIEGRTKKKKNKNPWDITIPGF
ncbi:MAG: HNH endonuclease [Candidatus Micrarchaeota archaeon]|nr:HNH endonuclease [Candidatus Micrarchaeota archaeon]